MTRGSRILLLSALLGGTGLLAWAGVPTKRPEDHVRGKQLWEQSCWPCHGKQNDGQGPAAQALVGGVPDLRGTITEPRYEALIDVIQQGRGRMPAYSETMDRREARRILVYLSRLDSGEEAPEAPEPEDEGAADEAEAEGEGAGG